MEPYPLMPRLCRSSLSLSHRLDRRKRRFKLSNAETQNTNVRNLPDLKGQESLYSFFPGNRILCPASLYNRVTFAILLAGGQPDSVWLFTCGPLQRMEIMGQKPCLELHAAWACIVEWTVCLLGVKRAGFSAHLLSIVLSYFVWAYPRPGSHEAVRRQLAGVSLFPLRVPGMEPRCLYLLSHLLGLTFIFYLEIGSC